jgi:hypothetical protein
MPSRLSWPAVLASCVLLVACGSSDGPGGTDDPDPPSVAMDTLTLRLADTTEVELSANDSTKLYRYRATEVVEVALFYDATHGAVGLSAFLPEDNLSVLGTLATEHWGGSLLSRRSSRIVLAAGQELLVRLVHRGFMTETEQSQVRLFLYRVNRAPESGEAAYAVDQVRGETLETSADVDEFTLAGRKDDIYVSFLDAAGSATVPPYAGTLFLYGPESSAPGPLLSNGVRPGALDDLASLNAVLPLDGTYRIVVQGEDEGPAAPSAYRFRLRRVNPAPESARATLAPGDSIPYERLDHIGDIDRFTIVGAPGQQFTAFVASDSSSWPFRTSIVSDSTRLLTIRHGSGLEANSGRLTLPASGQLQLVVSGWQAEVSQRQGYRLYLYPVTPAPEHGSATLAPGDSVLTESIDREGDIDDFTVTLPVPATLNVGISGLGTTAAVGATHHVYRADGSSAWPTADMWAPPSYTGRLRLPAGSYRIRVWGEEGRSSEVRGSYRLFARVINEGPELASSLPTPGIQFFDRIDPLGDVDTFTFDGTAGQWVRLQVLPAQALGSAIVARFVNPSGGGPFAMAGAWPISYMGELPATGRYTITVDAGIGDTDSPGGGSYTAQLDTIDTAPESAARELVPGGTATEPLPPFDVDAYRITGTPNQEVVVTMEMPLGSSQFVCTELMPAASPTPVGHIVGGLGWPVASGPVRLGADGILRVLTWSASVVQSGACGEPRPDTRLGGSDGASTYTLRVHALDRRPEVAPVAIASADTVREAIDHVGDIDEFRVTASAGQTVTVGIGRTESTYTDWHGLNIEVISPDGSLLWRTTDSNVGSFTVSQTGAHLVRAFGREYRIGQGPYWFVMSY